MLQVVYHHTFLHPVSSKLIYRQSLEEGNHVHHLVDRLENLEDHLESQEVRLLEESLGESQLESIVSRKSHNEKGIWHLRGPPGGPPGPPLPPKPGGPPGKPPANLVSVSS